MSSGAIRAGRAFVELFADDSKLARGLKNAQRKVGAFAGGVRSVGIGMVAVGTAIVAPLIAATAQFAASGDQLNKMSARTGVAVEELSALGFAAKRNGSDMKTLEGGLKRMQANLSDFKRGVGESKDRLEQLGFSANSFDGKSQAEQFKLIADRISLIADPGERAAAAMDIFGRSGQQLVPLLSQGIDGIEALEKKAHDIGAVMSTEQAQAAADFTDAWLDVKESLMGVSREIAAAIVPTLTDLLNAAVPFIKLAADWIGNNKQLVLTIAAVGVGLVAAGTAITGVGAALAVVIPAVSALATAFTFLLSPIGLVIAAVTAVIAAQVALVAWAIYASGILTGVGQLFGEVFGGIITALGNGDLEAAGEIAMLGLYAIWQRVWNNIRLLVFDVLETIASKMQALGVDRLLGIDAGQAIKGFDLGREAIGREQAAIEQELRDLIAQQDKGEKAARQAGEVDPLDTPAARDLGEIMRDLEDAIVDAGGGSTVPAGGGFVSPGELENAAAAVGARDDFLKGADVSGTFSGSALSGLGPETLQRSIADGIDDLNDKADETNRLLAYNKFNYRK